jgi:RNA polymerase sigma-70 factor, ECF subfamily
VVVGASDEAAFIALVESARNGDRSAFDQLDRQCRGGIDRVLRSRGVHTPEDIADLTQEVLIVAWRRLPQLREAARFRSWLWVIARRVAIAQGQRAQRDDAEEFTEKESDEAGPDVVAELGELSALVTSALHGLSERDQIALSLMGVGFQPIDIAAAMGVSPNTAKQIAKRARDRLRETLRVELSWRRREERCKDLARLVDGGRLIDAARHARSCTACEAAEADLQLYQLAPLDNDPDGN